MQGEVGTVKVNRKKDKGEGGNKRRGKWRGEMKRDGGEEGEQ